MGIEIAKKIISGRKAIGTAGEREKLVDDLRYCFKVDVSADSDNDDAIVVGDNTVVAALGAQIGTVLVPGAVVQMDVDQVGKIWADAIVDGDAVCFTYYVQ